MYNSNFIKERDSKNQHNSKVNSVVYLEHCGEKVHIGLKENVFLCLCGIPVLTLSTYGILYPHGDSTAKPILGLCFKIIEQHASGKQVLCQPLRSITEWSTDRIWTQSDSTFHTHRLHSFSRFPLQHPRLTLVSCQQDTVNPKSVVTYANSCFQCIARIYVCGPSLHAIQQETPGKCSVGWVGKWA